MVLRNSVVPARRPAVFLAGDLRGAAFCGLASPGSGSVGTVVSFGQVAGALGGAIFQPIAGEILQRARENHTQSGFVPLFVYSGCAYLVALLLLRTLAPGLKRESDQEIGRAHV